MPLQNKKYMLFQFLEKQKSICRFNSHTCFPVLVKVKRANINKFFHSLETRKMLSESFIATVVIMKAVN